VRDKSRLANDKCAGYARTRRIVQDGKIGMRMLVVPPVASEGCHDHPVLEGKLVELDGLEKFGGAHCKCKPRVSPSDDGA